MDLHFTDDVATEAERTALDPVLGEASVDARTGVADRTEHVRTVQAGHEARSRRDLLLPALHAVNDRVGWISPGAVNEIGRRLLVAPAEVHGVASFYGLFSMTPRPPRVLHLCVDLACRTAACDSLASALTERVGAAGSPANPGPDTHTERASPAGPPASLGQAASPGQVAHAGRAEPAPPSHSGAATWVESPCLGLCERAPAALVAEYGEVPYEAVIAPASLDALVAALDGGAAAVAPEPAIVIAAPQVADRLGVPPRSTTPFGQHPGGNEEPGLPPRSTTPFGQDRAGNEETERHSDSGAPPAEERAGTGRLTLLRRIGVVNPASLDDYAAHGGYEALRRAVELGPDGVIAEVTDAGLVGRGGAAFPAGRKWAAVAGQAVRPHELVCNADESEPGTFKDRLLLEGDPYAVLEAMTIAGYATGCERGWLYIRGEYPRAWLALRTAIDTAQEGGFLGDDVMGLGFRFDVELRRGAGAYICGEETAIFNSIEGYRGEPRNKPPFPVEVGLFGRPTLVNNVETLVNVLPILTEGSAAYAAIGTERSKGPKLFAVSGTVTRPGVYEVPFGTTLRALLDLAGGLRGGRTLQAVLMGGAAGAFVGPDDLDMVLSFEGAQVAKATLGSGVVMVLDDTVDLVAFLVRIAAFFRDESCGQCVPCRVGTVRQEEALHRLAARPAPGDAKETLELLDDVGRAMRDASICGLGQTAWNAIESAITHLGAFSPNGSGAR